MEIKLLGLLVFILITNLLCAQEEGSYKISKAFPEVSGWSFMSKGDEVLFTNGNIIQKYNSQTLEKISESTISGMPTKNWAMPYAGEPEQDKEFHAFQGNPYLFYYSWEKKSDEAKLFFRKIDFETGQAASEAVLVTTTRADNFRGKFDSRFLKYAEVIHISKDGTKMCVSLQGKVFVYDQNMKLLWKKEDLGASYKPNEASFSSGCITNNGTYYSIIKNRHGKENKGEVRASNYTLELAEINAEGFKSFKIKGFSDQSFVHEFKLYETIEGEIKGVGFFNYKGFDADGIITLNMDDLQLKYTPFPPETVHYYNSKMPKKPETNLSLRTFELHPDNNGGVLLTSMISNESDKVFYYSDFLVVNINNDEKINWMKRLPHRMLVSYQMATYRCHSYQYAYLNNKHYFMYLDHPKNETFTPKETPKGCSQCKNGFLRAYVLDNDGNISKESFFNLGERTDGSILWDFQTPSITPVSDSEFIFKIRKSKQKEEFLVKMKIKE